MSGGISPEQTLIMWCLLGRHGWVFQGDIMPVVKPKDREALVAAGYITSAKVDRKFVLKVEDKGWRWASGHLDAELPVGLRALQNWLARTDEFLRRDGKTLADFIGPAPEPPPEPQEKKPRSRSRKLPTAKTPKTPKVPKAPTPKILRKRIEAAYLTVTNGRKAEQALLRDVRAQLTDISEEIVDAGLLRILQGDKEGKGKARLGQINDPKVLNQSVRDAAFSPGGEPFHLLWIQT
jgi:hypothetical protein